MRCPLLTLALLTCLPAAGQEAVSVRFRVNDALVKDANLAGVAIRIARAPEAEAPDEVQGTTDASGSFEARLAKGTCYVTYELAGYVPLVRTATEVRAEGQVVTTTLSMSLEGEGLVGQRRIKLILNWGSDPQAHAADLDSHLLHEESGTHVWFSQKTHTIAGQEASLDVDDTNWGGPETVKLVEPPPGTYLYWIDRYTRPPPTVGGSEVVVRLLVGDGLVDEYRPPPEADKTWRPFKAIVVNQALETRVVDFSVAELDAKAHLQEPPFRPPPQEEQAPWDEETSADEGSLLPMLWAGFLVLGLLLVVFRKRLLVEEQS